jgi:hypothetical protein
MVQAALCGGDECEAVRKDLAARRVQGEVLIRKRLEQAKANGDLRPTPSPRVLPATSPP